MAFYEMALLGNPSIEQEGELKRLFEILRLQFKLGHEDIVFHVRPDEFRPSQRSCSAVLFIGGAGGANFDLRAIVDLNTVPILPVVSTASAVALETPSDLRSINCLFLDQVPLERVFSGLLECVGLLPRQRRIFLSYRRTETTAAAIQLFSELSARQFNVFLDTLGLTQNDFS